MLNKTYNPRINTSTDFMKSSLHSLSVKIILILLFLLSPFFTQAQELTDQQIGFDPTLITQSLKERGITDPAILDQEIAIMRESQKRMYQEQQKIQKEILAKIEKEQKKSSSTNRLTTTIPQAEREALIALYNSTDGPNWTNTKANNKPWKIDDPTSDVSTWYGVYILNGHVTSLAVSSNNLTGSLPLEMKELKELTYLTCSSNNLHGQIDFLSNLTNLKTLHLSDNNLSGDINAVSNLTKLTNLYLDYNQFSGNINAVANLTNLSTLDLKNNQFSGNINAVANLTNLTGLLLNENKFSGDINAIANLTNLIGLNLSTNQFNGKINAVSNLTKLTSISLSFNEFSGEINAFSNLTNLISLNLSDNQLSGNVITISNLSKLLYLNLENNLFTGPIPGFSNWTNIRKLLINGNKYRFKDFNNEFEKLKTKLGSDNFVFAPQAKINTTETTTKTSGNSVQFKMFPDGDTNYLPDDTYKWFKNNIEIPGATSREYTIPSVALTDAGTYTCKSYHKSNPDMSPLVLEREPITLTVTNCNTFPGAISIGPGVTCEKGATDGCTYTCGTFLFTANFYTTSQGGDTSIYEQLQTGTYEWKIKNPQGDVFFTSNARWPQYNLTIPGKYTVELKFTTTDGCVNNYNYNGEITVVGCTPISCTSSSKTTPIVKELFKNLITKLLSLPEGTVTNGYTCPELSELAPYLTNPSPAIEDFVIYKDSWLSEQRVWIGINLTKNVKIWPHENEDIPTFDNFAKIYDIAIDTGGIQSDALGQMTDVDVSSYTSPAIGLQNIPTTFENGFAKMYVNHVNFCPETIEQTYCINQALSLNFETQDANLNYSWSIVDSANAIIATGTTPTVVFTPTAEGTYKIKLTASSIDKCETTFTKLILVKNCIPLESCTKNNPNATHIAGLFKNLVNKLITLPTTSVPNGFTCPELVELIPYIADTDAKIYNFTNIGNKISFSFDNHDLGDHDVVISYPTGVQISGFNLDAFVNDQTLTKITTNYSNGLSESTLSKVRHINFCANKIISCTESNPRTVKVKELFVKLLNHLKKRIEEGKEIPNGYTCEELRRFKYYTTEPQNVYIYNFNAATFSFSFHNGTNNFDVSIPELMQHPKETIQSVDLNYYTSANEYTSMDWKITLSSGVKLANGKVKHVEFCPNEICVQHVAVVVDESGSLDESEKRKIRNQLLSFVKEQARINNDIGANMHISLIGMSDSDKPSSRRTDHILEIKPDLINTNVGGILYNWITNYGNRYTIPNDGISEGSDFWLSGLEVSLNSSFKVKPSMVIMITDGAQTDNAGALKDFMKNFDNFAGLKDITKPHLYVIGIKNGHYVYDPTTARTSNTLTKEEDPNFYPELDNISTANARVTSALSLSLKYLLGLEEVNKPLNLDINNFRTDYAGLDDFNLFRDDLTYISDKIAKADINCGEESIKETCDDCFSFQPKPGQFYVLNAWVKEDVTEQQKTYSNPKIKLTFYDGNNTKIGEEIFHTVGNIIDGWQRIGNKFEIPNNDFDPLQQTVFIDFELINESKNVAVFFDDIRIYPVKGSMKTFVYDPENFRLMSELDENNYSTFYEYDNEGGLVRIKKETAQGVKTIQETRSGNVIKNN